MKLGACTMIYLDYCTLEEALKRIARTGFSGVDIWADSPHLDPLRDNADERRDIKKLCEDLGLEIPALAVNGGGLAMRYNFSYSKDWMLRQTVDYYKACVGLAVDIGSPSINMISGHMMYGTTREQAWKWNRECMSEVCEYAGQNNVTMCLHTLTPSESRVVVTLDDALRMHEEIDSPACKIMIDTADQNITDPNLSDAVRKVKGKIVYCHISDNAGEGRGLVHNLPGHGTVNWRHFVQALHEINYTGYLTLQLYAGSPIDPDAWQEEAFQYMKNVLSEVGVYEGK